ncbi:MAG: hypothetical protein J2P17_26005, partial [Mycobacterium sp.]|nr:hypothetical protein [Mycobacterium sp.]
MTQPDYTAPPNPQLAEALKQIKEKVHEGPTDLLNTNVAFLDHLINAAENGVRGDPQSKAAYYGGIFDKIKDGHVELIAVAAGLLDVVHQLDTR